MGDIRAADETEYPEALAAMQAVMKRPTFTFLEVYAAGDVALGPKGPTCYRWADRLLQKARKAGQIRLCAARTWCPVTTEKPHV